MRYVWIMWGEDSEGKFLDSVYDDKVKAESDMRLLNERYPDARYYIQEKVIKR